MTPTNAPSAQAATGAGAAPVATSWAECTARQRLAHLVDAGSFHEWLPPAARVSSPHLAQLGLPAALDDGVAIGRATLESRPVFIAAQEGAFMGGGVGEVHGAKLVGLLRRALRDRPQAVLLLAESGGVRLHEANAGLIAVSEVMRAVLDVRAAGIPVLVLIGGANGCFGGMGIVARCADWVLMSDQGRHAMSGPEVIEASHGVDEFDSRDRALVWRTTGGKHRWLCGDCDALVADDVAAFRAATCAALAPPGVAQPPSLAGLEAEHALLAARLALLEADGPAAHPAAAHEAALTAAPAPDEATMLWARLGVADAARVPDLEVDAVRALRPGHVAQPRPNHASPGATA